jgi:hypothetical protein
MLRQLLVRKATLSAAMPSIQDNDGRSVAFETIFNWTPRGFGDVARHLGSELNKTAAIDYYTRHFPPTQSSAERSAPWRHWAIQEIFGVRWLRTALARVDQGNRRRQFLTALVAEAHGGADKAQTRRGAAKRRGPRVRMAAPAMVHGSKATARWSAVVRRSTASWILQIRQSLLASLPDPDTERPQKVRATPARPSSDLLTVPLRQRQPGHA